jgi:putative transposase
MRLGTRLTATRAMQGVEHAPKICAVESLGDHIHLLLQLPVDLSVAKTINLIKSNSSRWVHGRGVKFAWQEGYAAFSVSASMVPMVVQYIENQEAHHKRMDFDAEFLTLLKKHGVECDPKFVFG